jgi:hypothetical protein
MDGWSVVARRLNAAEEFYGFEFEPVSGYESSRGVPIQAWRPIPNKPVGHGWRVVCEGSDSPGLKDEVRRLSTPIAEELDLVPLGRDGQSGAKAQDMPQLLAN